MSRPPNLPRVAFDTLLKPMTCARSAICYAKTAIAVQTIRIRQI